MLASSPKAPLIRRSVNIRLPSLTQLPMAKPSRKARGLCGRLLADGNRLAIFVFGSVLCDLDGVLELEREFFPLPPGKPGLALQGS